MLRLGVPPLDMNLVHFLADYAEAVQGMCRYSLTPTECSYTLYSFSWLLACVRTMNRGPPAVALSSCQLVEVTRRIVKSFEK